MIRLVLQGCKVYGRLDLTVRYEPTRITSVPHHGWEKDRRLFSDQ